MPAVLNLQCFHKAHFHELLSFDAGKSLIIMNEMRVNSAKKGQTNFFSFLSFLLSSFEILDLRTSSFGFVFVHLINQQNLIRQRALLICYPINGRRSGGKRRCKYENIFMKMKTEMIINKIKYGRNINAKFRWPLIMG